MASIVWIVVGVVACVWVACMAVTAALALGARRNDPRVVVDDPWETETGRRDLARLQAAVAAAQAQATRRDHDTSRDHDFSRWEREVRSRPGPRVDRIVPQRPRPAA